MMKDIVVGLGQIGKPILQLISKSTTVVVGYDSNPKVFDQTKFDKFEKLPIRFLHVCIPYTNHFISEVQFLYKKFKPMSVVLHSTVSPYTTKNLQSKLPVPVIYSATRGVHKRMLHDLKRYTKFFSIEPGTINSEWASKEFSRLMRNLGVKKIGRAHV